MKITAKTSKETLKSFIGANVKMVKEMDKDLYDRIAYADKMLKTDESKVQKADLASLAKDIMKVLGDKCVEPTPVKKEETPKAENSVKKSLKKTTKEETPVEEKVETPTETPVEETPVEEKKVDEKKSAKKSKLGAKKKETPKKDDDVASEGTTQNNTPFPATLTVNEKNYRLATEIKSMDDLYEATNEKDMDEVVFAYHFTKKDLKLNPYYGGILGKVTSFENDLDLAGVMYVSEERKIAYQISLYTEGCYNTLPEDFEEFDGVRYAGDTMFQIYRRA